MNCEETLTSIKEHYPFSRWREAFDDGLEQYTQENCDRARTIADQLISNLISLGLGAADNAKIELFKTAVEAYNSLNEETDDSLIETGEREDLCDLINRVSEAAGLNPSDFGDGEGLASEWRDW